MSFEVPSQERINKEHQEQLTRINRLRDRVFEFTGSSRNEQDIRRAIDKVLTEEKLTHRESRIFYGNKIMTAVKNRLKLIEKKAREDKLSPLNPSQDTEPLYKHPVLGSNQ